MPTVCAHYGHLYVRVGELSRKFVDDQVASELADPAAFNPDTDRLAAYRLLIHAELEEFLEKKAREGLDALDMKIATDPLWARGSPEFTAIVVTIRKQAPLTDVVDALSLGVFAQAILSKLRNEIAENNGIKASSFLMLSVCAGKFFDEIDSALSITLNDYGKSRGDVAHRSAARVTTIQAPSVEKKSAADILSYLGTYFDVRP